LLEKMHERFVHPSRVDKLGRLLSSLTPADASVLDVGCGDGKVGLALSRSRPDIRLSGLDTKVRMDAAIPILTYDGRTIPFESRSWDVVLLVDVLHHADDPMKLMQEAARVSRTALLVKDHLLQGLFARQILRLMDVVGNRRYGVALPCNYWTRKQWLEAAARLKLEIVAWNGTLGLYPPPASWVFERQLHFMARLDPHPIGSS
jgi:SAM-dependent methyltransferase